MEEERNTVYGLIGYPLGHSLSPLMHNTAFEALGVPAVYKLFPLKDDELAGFFADLKEDASPVFGLNVTVPYKEKVLPYIDSLSPFARQIGAVNTIVIRKDRSLVGYNTDGLGFLTHLTEQGVETRKKRVAVLGAGGAARSIISALSIVPERPQAIRLYDIDKGKADQLAGDLRERLGAGHLSCVNSIDDLNIEISDILINATPVGMKDDDPVLVDEDLLHAQLFVYDVIYNPSQTRLLKMAQARGCRVSNGLGMLFYQGVLAFQHWADMELPVEIKDKMWQSLREGIEQSS